MIENILTAKKELETSISLYRVLKEQHDKEGQALTNTLSQLQENLNKLQEASINSYKGRSSFTHEQTLEARRQIRAVSGKWVTMGEICNALPHIERSLIEKEVNYLIERKALGWNNKRGIASKYIKI